MQTAGGWRRSGGLISQGAPGLDSRTWEGCQVNRPKEPMLSSKAT